MSQVALEHAIPEVIAKTSHPRHVAPNLLDHTGPYAVFSGEDAARQFTGLPGGASTSPTKLCTGMPAARRNGPWLE